MPEMIEFTSKGEWSRTEAWLNGIVKRTKALEVLNRYGQRGVDALAAATPSESGETANSWYYEVTAGRGGYSIVWRNNHMAGSVPVVILLEYGHGTGTGGYVAGREFIGKTIEPIFDEISEGVWRVVTSG